MSREVGCRAVLQAHDRSTGVCMRTAYVTAACALTYTTLTRPQVRVRAETVLGDTHSR